jgi:hypothetical protein
VRPALALAGLTALVLASAPSAEGAGVARPRVALSVSPARLVLAAPSSRAIKVRNDGAEQIVVDATRRTVGGQAVAKWLEIAPARVVLRSGETAMLTLRAGQPQRAEPGDHNVLVLLTTRPLDGGRVNVQVRLGVRIRMVVPGRIVRRLTLGGLRVHKRRDARFMVVAVANRGNVTVQLHNRVTTLLVRRGRRLARLNLHAQRALRPGARTFLALRYNGRVRGALTAVVRIRLGPGIRVERRYRIRL